MFDRLPPMPPIPRDYKYVPKVVYETNKLNFETEIASCLNDNYAIEYINITDKYSSALLIRKLYDKSKK